MAEWGSEITTVWVSDFPQRQGMEDLQLEAVVQVCGFCGFHIEIMSHDCHVTTDF